MEKLYDRFFLVDEESVIQYMLEKTDIFSEQDELEAYEIGDGNINYVFRVLNKSNGKSVIVKQANNVSRISDSLVLSRSRGKNESDILYIYNELIPHNSPKLYFYDEVMSIIVMQDMEGYTILRNYLMELNKCENLAEVMSEYLVKVLFVTSDIGLNHKKKKQLMKRFVNEDLCEISENLVFTEPYIDFNNQNIVSEELFKFVSGMLYGNKELHRKVAKLKFEFMNNAQALIHGDLHTGSIMVDKESKICIIDPEFGFYGPIGYDIGNLIANLIFSWCYAETCCKDRFEQSEYVSWVKETICEIVIKFKIKFLNYFDEFVTDSMAMAEGFKEAYLRQICLDTAGFAGTECIRRVVGLAKVSEITSVQDEDKRIQIERSMLQVGMKLVLDQEQFMDGNSYLTLLSF